jgi:hypothetical protein
MFLNLLFFCNIVQRWAVNGEEFIPSYHPRWVSCFSYLLKCMRISLLVVELGLDASVAESCRSLGMWRCFHTECGWAGQVKIL